MLSKPLSAVLWSIANIIFDIGSAVGIIAGLNGRPVGIIVVFVIIPLLVSIGYLRVDSIATVFANAMWDFTSSGSIDDPLIAL